MDEERQAKYNEMVARINDMSDEEITKLVEDDQCPFEPEHMIGVPMGMFHCEVCGDMVVAGCPHGRRWQLEEALSKVDIGKIPDDIDFSDFGDCTSKENESTSHW